MVGLACTSAAQVQTRTPAWTQGVTEYDAPFFDGATYDAAVKTPDELLGYRLGTRPATHAEVQRCLDAWRGNPRVAVHAYAESHERRKLYYAVITSAANHARLARIRETIAMLADPRKLPPDADVDKLVRECPAIAWMAYSIHGDEMSSTDAALAVIYHLLASGDADVAAILDQLVVIIDPLMNPDGRDRFIAQVDALRGYTPCFDAAGMQHAGRWPYGRGNHYYVDLNRDWILGTQPETRGRQKAIADWNPQLLVDSHEMDPQDTYLFNPPREPLNPNLSPVINKWWTVFAADQARAFDRYAWSYYTREWLEYWYPGYSDSWGSFRGAIGMLYEQARVGGGALRQPSGYVLTYRECVHHQAVSSLANLHTLRDHRVEILTDFHRHARDAIESGGTSGGLATPRRRDSGRVFVLAPGPNRSREAAFLENLANQGIEIAVAAQDFTAGPCYNGLRECASARAFPAGSWLISLRQPAARLAGAILDFDPRVSDRFLQDERHELETHRRSRIYDVSGWSVPLAAALDAWWIAADVSVPTRPYAPSPPATVGVYPAAPLADAAAAPRVYGYVIDGGDDRCAVAAAHLALAGVNVRVALKDFRAEGRPFPRGSLLMRVHENDARLAERLEAAMHAAGVGAYSVTTGLSRDDGPDLGGGQFALLAAPRVAMLAGSPVDTVALGNAWQLLDCDLGVPVTLFDAARGAPDLRRHNVLVLPPTEGDAVALYGPMRDELRNWVENGGTLIAIDNAVAPFVQSDKDQSPFSAVRYRQDVLDQLGSYATAVERERLAGRREVNPSEVWGDEPHADQSESDSGAAATQGAPRSAASDEDESTGDKARELDEYRRVFAPGGVIVRARLDREHWLTFACAPPRWTAPPASAATEAAVAPPEEGPADLPVYFAGSGVLMSKHPVETPVRLESRDRLRLSGLLWPEAAMRMADSAYVTVERIGHGQLILFACDPNFRGYFRGSRRLLVNAIVFGPGCGTEPPP